MDFFQKGGGGSEAIQKFWDTFCVKDFFKGLLGHFSRKCPKSSKSLEKVSQKFQKSGGGGGGGAKKKKPPPPF